MFADLTLYEFLLSLTALIISAPVLIVLGYLLMIILFYVFIFGIAAVGGACALFMGAVVVLWESIDRAWYRVKQWWKGKNAS